MKKWQKERNYRRIRNEAGEVIANIITVDGVDVEVPEDVYLAYSQADRRERYVREEVEPGRLLSLDKLLEDEVPLEPLGVELSPQRRGNHIGAGEIRRDGSTAEKAHGGSVRSGYRGASAAAGAVF